MKYPLILIAALAMSLTSNAADTNAILTSKTLSVTLDTSFPRILQYRHIASGAVIAGQKTDVSTVTLNGKVEKCEIAFKKLGRAKAKYALTFPLQRIEVEIEITVGDSVVDMQFTKVEEKGNVLLKRIEFPDHVLLSLDSSQPDVEIATALLTSMNDDHNGVFREQIKKLSEFEAGSDTGNYFFLSNGEISAGIASNNFLDIHRIAYEITEENGVKTCNAWAPLPTYRELETETVELPHLRVFITADRNGDGKADWQDAALVYREVMPKPYGHEYVKSMVGENIAMNFASGAQQPFLMILDDLKKIYLATDGIGNQVMIKGFSAEGHDSANTDYSGHYNERAGGLKDFKVLLNSAERYNARVGIHINASEVYPEAHRYDPDILAYDGNKPRNAWSWLDQSHRIDKRKDMIKGGIFESLDQMHREIPELDFVYVDTYWTNGWPAWKLAKKLRELELAFYTEGDRPLDPWTTWAHWRMEPASRILRFIWYSDRDLFNSDSILRSGRNDNDTFMGWQSKHNFNSFIHGLFSRYLPTKYLQHFQLLHWNPGKSADLSNGVKVRKDGDNVTVTRNGTVLMRWVGGGSQNRLFVPWDPIKETKIYVWDEVGTEITWSLPSSWNHLNEVYLYKLTDLGRAEETRLSVTEGTVTITPEKNIPYVMYPAKAPEQTEMVWGEGSLVKEPGFDSYGFTTWKRGPENADVSHIKIENDQNRNPHLVISGNNGAAGDVSQVMTGLTPGKTYVAAVWVQVKGKRTARIEITPLGKEEFQPVSNYVEKTNVRHGMSCDPRTGTNYQYLKVMFDMPEGSREARIRLKAEEGRATSEVEFDAVRVVETTRSPEAANHWFWEDFENTALGGFGPFSCNFDEYTHLSESNRPYTTDTINGRFSLKTRGSGRVARTLPSTIRFKPHTRYRLTCETAGGTGILRVKSAGKVVLEGEFPEGRNRYSGEFATLNDTESFIEFFKGEGDWVSIDDIAIDELGPVPENERVIIEREDKPLPGRKLVVHETFTKPLDANWNVVTSERAGTSIAVNEEEGLLIEAAANVSAFIERTLPENVTAVECRIRPATDSSETWGPGITLLWENGSAVRLNLRSASRRYGVDAVPGGQTLSADWGDGEEIDLRIRLEPEAVVLEGRTEELLEWQVLKSLPRTSFEGMPDRMRIGKMHAATGTGDHSSSGEKGLSVVKRCMIYSGN